MHPVLRHLLERRDKGVPVGDGRRISLVLFGGMMTGVQSAGAMMALGELGLHRAFDDIFTISCGFPNASYFLSGQHRLGISIYSEDLSGCRFINFLRPWKLADVDFMAEVMRSAKALDVGRVLAGNTRLHVRLFNCNAKEIEYLEVHSFSQSEYHELIRAATSLSLFHPGSVRLRNFRYKDPDFLGDHLSDHLRRAVSSGATDVLVVYSNFGQYQNRGLRKYVPGLGDRVCELHPPPGMRMSRLETRPRVLKGAAEEMGSLVKQAFGEPVVRAHGHRH